MSRPTADPLPPPDTPPGAGRASAGSGADSQADIRLPAPPRGPRTVQRDGPPSHRDDILIPDYTLIKRIGSGAYGEVWLAQSVTGAYRAVKIVWREDFELTRTFHREFLGIQQFEPISRGHPCMVHILHVGWNEERGFYYCVMELADDAEEGPNFEDVKTYVPRTLGTDMKRHGRLDLTFCRDAGVYLADALAYMHNRGLTHRDIKPSNIIFCGGVCKLADIGLVAGFGERTFVGTEGFVPPEGPGTAQADIYSLGKVLYEMSSGKDRMEFPEVPANLGDEEWPFWLDLNRVICKACAPDLKERFATATEFAEALQRVGDKKPESFIRRFSRAAVYTLVGSALAAAGLTAARYQNEWAYELPLPVKAAPPLPQPPQKGRPWQNIYGQWFTFTKDRHIADLPVEVEFYRNNYLEATQRPAEFGVAVFATPDKKERICVTVGDADADDFAVWMTSRDRQSGRLDIDHEYSWRPANLSKAQMANLRPGRHAIRMEIVKVPYGRVSVDSTPKGAEVYDGELRVGRTPLQLTKVRAAKFEYEVRLPGYKSEYARGNLKEGQAVSFNLRLRATGSVVFGKPWENSLEMKMVPMGRAMLSTIETRRRDFAEFARSINLPSVAGRNLEEEQDLPVTLVTRAEAEQFCRWLTDRERAKGLLEPDQEYRLPTDDEWSMAAYLPREVGTTPAERSTRIDGVYAWGVTPLPASRVANLRDESVPDAGKKAVTGYVDGYAGLAPAGSLEADGRKLHDLAGNVWEWVADDWDAKGAGQGAARGGAYTTYERQQLLASYRRKVPVDAREPDVGFRVLLITSGLSARDDD